MRAGRCHYLVAPEEAGTLAAGRVARRLAGGGVKGQASAVMVGLLLTVACSPNIIAPSATASDAAVSGYPCGERDRLVQEYMATAPKFDTKIVELSSGERVFLEMVGGEVLRVTHVSGPTCAG